MIMQQCLNFVEDTKLVSSVIRENKMILVSKLVLKHRVGESGAENCTPTLRFSSHISEEVWRQSGFDKRNRKVKCCGVCLCTLGQTHMPLQLMRWRRGHLGLDITSALICPLFHCRLSHLIATFLTRIDYLQVQFKFESSYFYPENDDKTGMIWSQFCCKR